VLWETTTRWSLQKIKAEAEAEAVVVAVEAEKFYIVDSLHDLFENSCHCRTAAVRR
jgi:hypothetical protein